MRKQFVKRSTIDDVARLAGVSKTTVSRFLNGNHQAIAEETGKRIKDAMLALDYRPNQMARGLKHRRSYLIGMVIADITNPYSTAILRGAEDVCKQHGYSLMVCNTDNDPVKERDYILRLHQQRIDGLIITTTGHNNEFLLQLANEDIYVVLVDRKIPELKFDTVIVNNHPITAEAIQYLVRQGYERIAFFSEPYEGISSRSERLTAFQEVLGKWGHPSVDDVFLVDLQQTYEFNQKLEDFLQDSQGQSRVLFAVNGVVMLRLIVALQEKGIAIPTDTAICGFDNLDWAPAIAGGITTIAQPTCEIGVEAIKRVIKRIEGDVSPPETTVLEGKLIIRGSTPIVDKKVRI